MHILGRDLKKIIKEEIGREMRQHANNETLSKHSSLSEEDDIINEEDGEHDEDRPPPYRSDTAPAAKSASQREREASVKSKSLLLRTLNSPEYQATQDAMAADNARFAAMMADPESFKSRTASTQPVMDFGTTDISPDNIRDIEDNLPEGKNITDRLMERWLR